MASDVPHSIRSHRLLIAPFACSALTVFVLVLFFVIGVGDGSVSSFNVVLWMGLLAVTSLSLWVGLALHRKGRFALSLVALSITAVPGLVAALFVLLLLVTQQRWN